MKYRLFQIHFELFVLSRKYLFWYMKIIWKFPFYHIEKNNHNMGYTQLYLYTFWPVFFIFDTQKQRNNKGERHDCVKIMQNIYTEDKNYPRKWAILFLKEHFTW